MRIRWIVAIWVLAAVFWLAPPSQAQPAHERAHANVFLPATANNILHCMTNDHSLLHPCPHPHASGGGLHCLLSKECGGAPSGSLPHSSGPAPEALAAAVSAAPVLAAGRCLAATGGSRYNSPPRLRPDHPPRSV